MANFFLNMAYIIKWLAGFFLTKAYFSLKKIYFIIEIEIHFFLNRIYFMLRVYFIKKIYFLNLSLNKIYSFPQAFLFYLKRLYYFLKDVHSNLVISMVIRNYIYQGLILNA